MAILGDVIDVHHRRNHPRLADLDDSETVASISRTLDNCQASIHALATLHDRIASDSIAPRPATDTALSPPTAISPTTPSSLPNTAPSATILRTVTRRRIVVAYSTHILHVLHVLLHGKWDPISMLANEDYWITSPRFGECASHAISASDAVADILRLDPELTFMPYLFGIYLLHGSFILLLFADRMPQLGGPNTSVARACETLIRAHEVCVVTLSTEFQRSFRKVLRATLYAVQGLDNGLVDRGREGHRAQHRVLELYRWTRAGNGLAL